MNRTRSASIILAAASVWALTSCGSSGPTAATKDALAACQSLVNLGSQLTTTKSGVQGSDIQAQLDSARSEAASAAKANATQWSSLAKDVDVFVAALEGGKNASAGQTQAVDSDCSPFLPPPTTTSP